ncbi:MAG TPA: outer membrane beta-barrel protein [Bacteroidia bacterium]|nr:outer membrane beta-barrel protein [Bacteroidia bacterium]
MRYFFSFLSYNFTPKKLALILFFFLFVFTTKAQQPEGKINGKITGVVIDSATAQPIEYASIGLLPQDGTKEINGTTTDGKGNFIIHNIPEGKYKIAIYFIGYKSGTVANIQISKKNHSINLGGIKLASTQTTLKEVTVTAKSELVEFKIDKIVYNAENDITTQGGAAIDILKKVPQITVDIDGNVELQGNANIRFLINGKPSSIFGNSLADALASIPASQIKSIEAITSPGSKYDAQGTGGIINIILKENKVKGINGNISLNGGTRFENGSANINYKNNNFGLNAFFGGNAQLTSHTPNSQDRTSTDAASQTTTHLTQDGYTDFQRHGYNTGLGFEWNINKQNSITGTITYNNFGNKGVAFINQEQITQNSSSAILQDAKGYRNSTNASSIGSVDCNLSYLKKFKKEGQELSITAVTSNGTPNSNYVQTQSNAGASTPYTGISSSNPGTDNNLNISIDYAHPITEKFVIETGAKHVEQNINSITNVSFLDQISDVYQNSATQSYSIKYNMKIYAAYVSSNFTLLNWLNVKLGARSEYTNINIDFPNTSVPSYNIIVPSIILSHKFKNEQQFKISYTRRLERPDYMELNPFINFSDPHNLSTGNPKLRPEISDFMEMGYSKSFANGGNIYLALYERINTQDLKSITLFYPTYPIRDSIYTNVSVSTRQNIGAEYNSGGSVSASYPITEKFKVRINVNASHRYIVGNMYVGNVNMGFRYRGNLNLSYQLPKNLIVEAFGNYNSAAKNVQGLSPQSITYTIALRKQFWNKKASFGLTATNPFNQYIKQVSTIVTSDYSSYSTRYLPYRSFGISFTYKFGKLEFKKSKESEDTNPAPPMQSGN